MAYEQKDMNGALFRNPDKTPGDKWPDYTGKAMIGGKLYYLSSWLKLSKNGDKFMSIAFKLAEQKGQPAIQRPAKRDDDSIPF